MKVIIPKPRRHFTSNLSDVYLQYKYKKPFPTEDAPKLLEYLDDKIQWLFNNTINKLPEKEPTIRIDRWDTWSMDSSLNIIIIPMLKQLKETKHGAPFVDNKYVPEELHIPEGFDFSNGDTDENFFKRWDYVLDHMIEAFEMLEIDIIDYAYDDEGNLHKERFEEYQSKTQEGLHLFATFYQSLWD